VYVHVKGWSRARVTHVDIELPGLEHLVGGAGRGEYGVAVGTAHGFRVEPYRGEWGLEVETSDPVLKNLLNPDERCLVFIGGKRGGLFLGFKSPYHRVLESLAERYYGVRPRRKLG
jgi:hypothetical protein